VRTDVLFAELALDFGGELVVGGGPFREPPTVMQSTVYQVVNLYKCQTSSTNIRTLQVSCSSGRDGGVLWTF